MSSPSNLPMNPSGQMSLPATAQPGAEFQAEADSDPADTLGAGHLRQAAATPGKSARGKSDRVRLGLALAGAVLTLGAALALRSASGQRFSEFLSFNGWPLAAFGTGLALFFFGWLGASEPWWPGAVAPGRKPRHSEAREARHDPMSAFRGSLGALLLALGLAAWALALIDTRLAPLGLDGPALLLAGLGLLVAGAAALEHRRRRGWWRDMGLVPSAPGTPWTRRDRLWLLLVLSAWFSLQLWQLDTAPGAFHIDEALIVTYGRQIYAPIGNETLTAPWANVFHPYLSCVPRAWASAVWPARPYFGPRAIGVAVGAAMLVLFFLLARRNFGRLAAWLTFALMASSHVLLPFARSGLTNLDALLMAGVWALAWTGAWRTRRPSLALLAGVTAGLGVYAYYGALALLPLTLVSMALAGAAHPRAAARRWGIAVLFLAGYGAAMAPNWIYVHLVTRDAEAANWHTGMVFVLADANREATMRELGAATPAQMMLRYAWPSLGGVLLWPNSGFPSEYVAGDRPLLDRPTMALFMLGLVGAAARWRRRLALMILGTWLAATMLLASWLTIQPPYAPRLVVPLAAGYVLAGWVLASLAGRARCIAPVRLFRPVSFAGCVIVGVVAVHNAIPYYTRTIHYRPEASGDPTQFLYHRTPGGFMRWVGTVPREALVVYWAWSPWVMFHSSCLLMFDHGFTRRVFDEPGAVPPPMPGRRTAYMIHLPDMTAMDPVLRRRFPSVKPIDIHDPWDAGRSAPTHRVWWVDSPPGR